MNLEALFELCLFFIFLVYVFQALQALDLSKIFKKGYTNQIRLIYVMICIITAYLLSQAIMNVINLSRNLIN